MPYSITKIPDGDLNLGSISGEIVNLQPSTSDYATSGYALIDGETVVNNSALASSLNVDLYRVLFALPVSGQNGYVPEFNSTTKKVKVMRQNGTTGPLQEVPAGTDLSALTFQLLLGGL